MATYFTSNANNSGVVGADLWINMGTIPLGNRVWLGNAQYASPNKSITFELRTNTVGNSTGSDAQTSLLYSTAVSPKSGTLTVDLYKNGRLHITSIYGTGTENWWLRLKSKSGASGNYLYSINYTTE